MLTSESDRTLLLFGGTGFVGGHLAALAASDYRVLVSGRGVMPTAAGGHRYRKCDPSDAAAVAELFAEERPWASVNVAAISNIDYAESHREETRRANIEAARLIAEAAAESGGRHIFLSSDAVFSGKATGYAEEDPAAPVNHYGRTKAEAEAAVLQACPGATIIRVSLILGFPVTEAGGFLAGLAGTIGEGVSITAPEYRIPHADRRRHPV